MQVKSLDSRASAIVFIEVVICLVINITSLVGNILVCLSVYRNSRLRTSTNLYIIGLAIADLLSAVIVMPFTTIVLISGDWIIGPFLCDLHAFVMNFVLFVSPTTMALTAFNRYIRIVKPGKYMTVFSKRRSVMMLGSAWAFVAFFTLPFQSFQVYKIMASFLAMPYVTWFIWVTVALSYTILQ